MKKFEQLRYFGRDFATESLVPGVRVYGERVLKKGEKDFRVWDFHRSKLAAAVKLGLKRFPFNKSSKILYLGAGNGTTASHISDICSNGMLYCVEFSPRSMTDLYQVCLQRKNMSPVLADANKPDDYAERVEKADVIYQDIAQKWQVDILNKNVDMFLKENGYVFLMVKARSIDVTMEPKQVFSVVVAQLEQKYNILERIVLDPYEKDHCCIVAKLK